MATLLDSSTILHENGKEYPLGKTPDRTRIWASWENTVESIWKNEKLGEVLVYDQEPVRWRKQCNSQDHSWGSIGNNQDVYLLKTQGFPTNKEHALLAFMEWRDWVEEYGANAFGTVASVSWSLWRATLQEDFYSPPIWPPAIKFPIGGRLIPCKELNSCWVGEFLQWDLQAAYAKELSGIRYGGKGSRWVETKEKNFRELSRNGVPVYIVSRVWVPHMKFGPLPQRRAKYNPFSKVPIHYNTNAQLRGTWTLEEIEQAQLVGCKVEIERIYIHVATGKELHFMSWWNAIDDGRNHLTGFARYLAKSTGNCLWGQFALREKARKIRWINEEGKRAHRVIQARMRNRPSSPELSDQLTGKVRAKLYALLLLAGEDLMQANTDGAWICYRDGFIPPSGWRIKKRAKMIEFIDESNYRYWEEEKETPSYCMAGIPMAYQERFFESEWSKVLERG